MSDSLTQRRCGPCEGGVAPLTRGQFDQYLEQIDNWSVFGDKRIERGFEFKSFAQALKFVNAVAGIAEEEGHHPDILLHDWNKVRISLRTHAIDGLSVNDFIVAAKIDRINQD